MKLNSCIKHCDTLCCLLTAVLCRAMLCTYKIQFIVQSGIIVPSPPLNTYSLPGTLLILFISFNFIMTVMAGNGFNVCNVKCEKSSIHTLKIIDKDKIKIMFYALWGGVMILGIFLFKSYSEKHIHPNEEFEWMWCDMRRSPRVMKEILPSERTRRQGIWKWLAWHSTRLVQLQTSGKIKL